MRKILGSVLIFGVICLAGWLFTVDMGILATIVFLAGLWIGGKIIKNS